MKRVYVKDLVEGLRVDDAFVVASKSVGSTRSGSPYLRLRLADRTGAICAVKWNATEAEIAAFGEKDIVRVRGTAGNYQEELQLTLDSCRKADEPVDPADFLPVSQRDPDEMLAELKLILSTIRCPSLSQLLRRFFDDPEFIGAFREAPAAKRAHHAWVGGLLEHTLGVVRACAALADLYPRVDRDLLLTAAALHDAGKIEEYTWSAAIGTSDSGYLIGHLVSATVMVREAAESVDGFDQITSLALQHAILAHHGFKEFGSPKRPKSIEAQVLHMADDLDAKVEMMRQFIDESDSSGEGGLFTKRHKLLDRHIFRGANRQRAAPASADEDEDLEDLAIDPDWDPFGEE